MPVLEQIKPDPIKLVSEVKEFRDFLAKNPTAERKQFLPFFYQHRQICSFMATFHDRVSAGTDLKTEADLWGEFVCDLVTGSRTDRAFVFVEFEDAAPKSVFRSLKGRKNTLWGSRIEQGFSQVVDWLFCVENQMGTHLYQRDFGRYINAMGIVVVGRNCDVTQDDRVRLDWRSANTVAGRAKVGFLTYDDLLGWLEGRLQMFDLAATPKVQAVP